MKPHCPAHAVYNAFCPSCIELDRKSSKPAAEPAPKSEDKPEEHEDN